jgi:Spy/CpxP family protein refolding chaperone
MMMRMISAALKAKLLVFAVFFIAIATGVLIMNFYETRVSGNRADRGEQGARALRAQREINEFHDYLGLDQAQRDQINSIMEEMRSEFRNLAQETRPKYSALQEQSRERIRAVLNDEQRLKYDEYIESRRNRDRRGRDRGANESEPRLQTPN